MDHELVRKAKKGSGIWKLVAGGFWPDTKVPLKPANTFLLQPAKLSLGLGQMPARTSNQYAVIFVKKLSRFALV